jgi:hypothetical protein
MSISHATRRASAPDTVSIVWSGSKHYDDPTDAIAREKQLKKWRRDWKIRLIEEVNPDWRDYYPALLPSPSQFRCSPPRHPPWVTIVAPGRKSATMAINAQRRHWTDPFAGRNINWGARRRAVLIIRMHLRTSRH